MRIVKIDPSKIDKNIIKQAASIIERGGILVYPTDTCYGLGVNPKNEQAVASLTKLKGRDETKKFSLIVSDFWMVKQICQVDKRQESVLKKYLPGPFTFVLEMKSGQGTIGVRIPDYSLTKILSKEIRIPYTTTSANLSGKKECYDMPCVVAEFLNQNIQPDLILDAGKLPKNPPSTVVDLSSWPPKILRKGSGNFSI